MTELYFCRIEGTGRDAASRAAHALLERTAAQRWPELPRPLPLARDKNGKPFFAGFPDCHFNLSHSGGWAACVLGSVPVGVDIQQHRAALPAAAKKFTAEEQALLAVQPDMFFDLWVKKEAYLKAVGAGLTRRLDSFSVLPSAENRVGDHVITLEAPPEAGYSCAVCRFDPPDSR